QIAAGALGEGVDTDSEEDPAARAGVGCARGRESGSVLPPDVEHKLPADGVSLDDFAAGNGGAVLPRLVPGAGDRFSVVYRVDVLDFVVLPDGGARDLSEDVETDVPLSAIHHGGGNRPFGAQRGGGD